MISILSTSFGASLILILIGSYLFHNYKQSIKRHRIRVALWTELYESFVDIISSHAVLNKSKDVSFFQKDAGNRNIFDTYQGNLHILGDQELSSVIQAYNSLESRRRNMDVAHQFKEDEGLEGLESFDKISDLSKKGIEDIEVALNTLERYIEREERRIFSWRKLLRVSPIHNNDVFIADDLREEREAVTEKFEEVKKKC